MVQRKLGEGDLDISTLYTLNSRGPMNTSELKSTLKDMLNPTGENLDALVNRNDAKIDQIIRNLVSHRDDLQSNLIYRDLVRYDNGVLSITDKGKASLDNHLVRDIVESLE